MTQSSAPWWRGNAAPAQQTPQATGSNVPFNALLVFTFVMILSPQSWFPALAPLRIALLSAGLALVAHCYSCLRRGLPILTFDPIVVTLLCLVAWATITLPFSTWPGGSVEHLVGDFSKTVIIFLLLAQVVDTFSKLYRVCWALVLMALPLAITTINNFSDGNYIDDGNGRVLGYQAGLTSNPNDMALMLNLILCLCLALLFTVRRSAQRLILVVIAVLVVMAIIATFSRAGFLTLAVIAASYAWLLRSGPQKTWLPVAVLAALVALPLAPPSYVDRIATIVNIEQDETGSAQSRLADMKIALRQGLMNPVLGAGIGMDILALNEARGDEWLKVHNVYLQYLLDLGVLGLGLFLLLYYQCLDSLRRVIVGGRSTALAKLAKGLRISLIAFAISALFYPVAYSFYFYYMAGLSVAAGRIFTVQQEGELQ